MSGPPEETVERLLGGRVGFEAMAAGLKPTTDTVMLAAAVAAEPGDHVLDAGCGSGGAALCLAARCPDCTVTGLERDAGMAQAAARNVRANGWCERITVEQGDLAGLRDDGGAFDIVMTNPPHLDPAVSRAPADPVRAAAMIESMALADWIGHCFRVLRPGGTLVLLHRAERLGDILGVLEACGGAAAVMPLWPRAGGSPAGRILVRAVKGARGPLRLLRGMVLHEADGTYTAAAQRVLRSGEAIAWS